MEMLHRQLETIDKALWMEQEIRWFLFSCHHVAGGGEEGLGINHQVQF